MSDKQQSVPASTLALDRDVTVAPQEASTSQAAGGVGGVATAKPKQSRKDRAKRLLLSLATKHHNYQNHQQQQQSPRQLADNGSAVATNDRGSNSPPPVGGVGVGAGAGAAGAVSPLLTATDAATVRPGMVLASVAARTGQGVSEEAVDTLGMGVKEAIDTLVRWVGITCTASDKSRPTVVVVGI